ncbi:hypothetical protein [Methanobacterium lacus]|nr:hypothetical protein [Methanobacterium lacus]
MIIHHTQDYALNVGNAKNYTSPKIDIPEHSKEFSHDMEGNDF